MNTARQTDGVATGRRLGELGGGNCARDWWGSATGRPNGATGRLQGVMGAKLCTGLAGFSYREGGWGYRELRERNCAPDTC
eukprot:4079999-Pleurochrysis_carterae.AAC.1